MTSFAQSSFHHVTKRTASGPESRYADGRETDYVPVRFSLQGLQEGIHANSPHVRGGKGAGGLPALRQQADGTCGSCVLRGYIEKELNELGTRRLAFAAIEDLELVAGIGWEEAGYVTQTLSQRGRVQQRIVPFAQVVVVKVHGKREHINGQRVRE